ncbi:MAG TPA: UPF0179 family protein [Methanothermococcus okinawensis]|uniref:UPF0179 protein EYH55_05530 n=1 Tax=Methanothermococcus okinawensis TaxID=155863 RepID=A0A832ZZR7_9EURY|nr:UPF0179 family protein [Methanothermococcus okinawensis]
MEKKVTLIGSRLAKTGNEFIYYGMLKECDSCRFKKICHEGMVVGRRYRILCVRSADHPCKVHEGGVKVVEIEESQEITMLIESRKALEGLTLSDSINCNNIVCENYFLCNPEGLPEKYRIVKVFKEKISCPKGYSLRKVVVSPVD